MRLLSGFLIGLLLSGGAPAAEVMSFQDREALAKLQAMDLFPDLEDEHSKLATQVTEEVKRLEAGHPAFFKQPAWPVRVARLVASRLDIRPRSVAEIRAGIAKSFDLDPAAIQRIHGIRIISARFSLGGEWLDLTAQIASRISIVGLAVDCDRALAATLADESQFHRKVYEADADYWKRQRSLLAAVANAREGQAALEITFEFQSERVTAAAKEGERLTISEEGKTCVSKVAPSAGPVKMGSPVGKAPQK